MPAYNTSTRAFFMKGMALNQIKELPTPNLAGTTFDYTVYRGVNSRAALHRVPWSSDYRDVAQFEHTNALLDYLGTTPTKMNFTFPNLKLNAPVDFDIPVNEAMEYNYLSVWNPAQPTNGEFPDKPRWLFYFINDVIWMSGQSTRLVLQLDIMQTYFRDVTFGECYVEQGHVGIADTGIKPSVQGILSQPDGLNLGQDYVVVEKKTKTIASRDNDGYSVVIVSTSDLEADYGELKNPELKSAKGSDWENLPNGTATYVFKTPNHFRNYMAASSDSPWVTAGIVSITAIPAVEDLTGWDAITLNGIAALKPRIGASTQNSVTRMWPDFRAALDDSLPIEYRHLKKFGSYPYTFFEMSTYTGEALVLKPELWRDDDARMVIHMHLAQPAPRIGIRPYNYNAGQDAVAPPTADTAGTLDKGEVWNVATWLDNMPQFSVVNNGYLMTMASQAHGIAQSYKDASWSQQKALTGNQAAYDMASSGMNMVSDMNQNNISAMNQQTDLANATTTFKGIQNGINGAISGAAQGAVGGVAGAVGGAALGVGNAVASAAIAMNQQTQSNAIQTRLSQQQTDSQLGNSGMVRDTNKSLSDWAARGDYQNQIASINAKVEDAKLTQPSTSGTNGGDAFIFVAEGWNVNLKVKRIPIGALRVVGDYWLRYGYPINRFSTPPADWKVCTIFSYWKVKETYVTSAKCTEPVKQAIRGVLEKGVTFWHDPTKMGMPGARIANKPIMGAYLPPE